MSYKLDIKQKEDFPQALFEVTVSDEDGESKTVHQVGLSESFYQKLSDGEVLPEELIRASFRFLLENEPNTAILSEFDLPQISQYFPDFEKVVVSYW